MTAQIRPNRMEVSDRFPMLGFAVKVDEPNVEAEVVLANDIALFAPENRTKRTAANFYSSREHGTLMVPRGDGVFVVAPEVLARFIGSERLHFGLATGRSGNGGLKVDALPRDGSPYVSLRGFTGRTLRRSFGSSRLNAPPRLEWTGDAAKPGSEGVAPARNGNGNGHANGSNGSNGSVAVAAPPANGEVTYNDGFGPLPEIPARESAYRGNGQARAPRLGYTLSDGTSAQEALAWIQRKIEQVVDAVGDTVPSPSLHRLEGDSALFVSAWEKALGWTSFIGINGFLAQLPALARTSGVTLSIGPVLETPAFGGGVGVVFAPDGQVALFGAGEVSISLSGLMEFVDTLKAALTVSVKLGYNRDGLEGFARLGKVAGVTIGGAVVGGAEVWLDSSGSGLGGAVSIGVGFSLQFAAEPRRAPAAGLVFGEEDMQRARTVARHHRDLFQWIPPQSIIDQITARGFGLQRIADAIGDINLDHYQIRIDSWPAGWDGQRLLQHFIRHVNDFVDTGNTSFAPYGPTDAVTLASANPLGTVFNLDIVGPDNAAVVISAAEAQYYAVSTIRTPDTGDHPVSGHRQFGYFIEDGVTTFYTRGADRSTMPLPGMEWVIWSGAESLWQSFQQKVAAWATANGGSATIMTPFSQRFNPTAMRLTYGHLDTAQGMSVEEAAITGPAPAFVPPPLPSDPRQRANRIGGQFGPRIGEALDLGLQAKALDALLDTLDPPLVARPMGYRPRSSALNTAPWSINWDGVTLIGQPNGSACWSTAASMLVNWRDGTTTTPAAVAGQCGVPVTQGLVGDSVQAIANTLRLQSVPPQCYSPEGFRSLIANNGPLFVVKLWELGTYSGHAVLVVGMYFDGADHFVRIVDPWDRDVGSPGSPGGYTANPANGSRYIMRYADFQAEYEMAINGDPANVQILHPGGPNGHVLNIGLLGNRAPGFAMTAPARNQPRGRAMTTGDDYPVAPAPPPRARAMTGGAVEAAIAIGGIAIETVRDNVGDITWDLDQFRGIKHPNDAAPANPAPFQDGTTVNLNEWPSTGPIIDSINAWFAIDWQYNGRSLGNVRITNIGTNDAIGASLSVRAQIMDDNRLYAPNDCAALRITFHYRFSRPIGSDHIAITVVHLYGDGTWETDSRWVQSDVFGMGTSGRLPPANTMAPSPSRSRGFDAGAIATIVGTAVTIGAAASGGDVHWSLPAWPGKKHPTAGPASPEPEYQQNSIALIGWPNVDGTYLNTSIRFFYNGTSLGPIYVEPGHYDDSIGWGLTVTGTMQDDPRDHPRSAMAMVPGPDRVASLVVLLQYQFQGPPLADDPTATTHVRLYADGTHEIDNGWSKRPGGIEGAVEAARYPQEPDRARTNVPIFSV